MAVGEFRYVPEEAVEILPETIEQIVEDYDVLEGDLQKKIGWYFVGEIDCNYWYTIISKRVFNARYTFAEGANPVRLSPILVQR